MPISHLKKVLSPDIGVEASSQLLDILEYACGLRLDFALISNESPNFELAYKDRRHLSAPSGVLALWKSST